MRKATCFLIVPLLKFVALYNQHCVAKTEKTISLLNRHSVGIHCIFVSAESRDQHDQRAFRQVEVRDQTINCAELITWVDKNVRVAAA